MIVMKLNKKGNKDYRFGYNIYIEFKLPDTIILNDRDCPGMWFYSSSDGYVYRTDSFIQRNVLTKYNEYATHDNELVAVLKKP